VYPQEVVEDMIIVLEMVATSMSQIIVLFKKKEMILLVELSL